MTKTVLQKRQIYSRKAVLHLQRYNSSLNGNTQTHIHNYNIVQTQIQTSNDRVKQY